MSDTPRKKLIGIGMALTCGVAVTIDCYTFSKNTPIESLLFFSLALIGFVLIGLAVSYFAYRHLRNSTDLPAIFLALTHVLSSIALSLLMLKAFIYFRVPYGYFLFPIAIELSGSFIFVVFAMLLQSTLSNATKIIIPSTVTALLLSIFALIG